MSSPALSPSGPVPDDEAEYQAWLDRELAAGRDPRDALGPPDDELSDEPEEPDWPEPAGEPPSDDELIEAMQAARRLIAGVQYQQVLWAAEFGRRRQRAFAAAGRRGVPEGCRPGGFPGEELAIELVVSRAEAGHLLDDSADLTTRLPRTLAAMGAGLVDLARAGIIAYYTRSLSLADAALADEILAAAAPGLRTEQLARKAAALEARLNPEGVAARKEQARRDHQRVEARREHSGNASLAGRELDVADVLAGKAHIDAVAARLRASGLSGLTLDQLRVRVFADLLQGREPLDRLAAVPPSRKPAPPDQPGQPADSAHPGRPAAPGSPPGPAHPGGAAPLPALVNLIVPAATLLGDSAAPAQAGSWGILDRDDTRTVATAAARHPATRWCLTLTGPDGTALAHGCARGPRPHLLDNLGPQPPPGRLSAPGPQSRPGPQPPASGTPPGQRPPSGPAPPPARLAELIRRLNLTLTPLTRGPCNHDQAENHYTPSRHLRHLIRARTATCDAPGCDAPALNADLDHTCPWPDGPTCPCNLAPRCRTHHRAKQAPDWQAEQLAPGVTRWTLPSGRTHVARPTRYDV